MSRALVAGEAVAVQRELLVLEERLRPACRDVLREHWGRLANHFNNERTSREIALLFDDYAIDLAEFSEAHLIESIQEHRRTKNWFPKVAELRALALRLAAHDRVMRHRCRVLLGIEEPSSWERPLPEPAPSPAEEASFGVRPQLESQIEKLPPELAASVRRLYAAKQERLGRPGPLFGRRSA